MEAKKYNLEINVRSNANDEYDTRNKLVGKAIKNQLYSFIEIFGVSSFGSWCETDKIPGKCLFTGDFYFDNDLYVEALQYDIEFINIRNISETNHKGGINLRVFIFIRDIDGESNFYKDESEEMTKIVKETLHNYDNWLEQQQKTIVS